MKQLCERFVNQANTNNKIVREGATCPFGELNVLRRVYPKKRILIYQKKRPNRPNF